MKSCWPESPVTVSRLQAASPGAHPHLPRTCSIRKLHGSNGFAHSFRVLARTQGKYQLLNLRYCQKAVVKSFACKKKRKTKRQKSKMLHVLIKMMKRWSMIKMFMSSTLWTSRLRVIILEGAENGAFVQLFSSLLSPLRNTTRHGCLPCCAWWNFIHTLPQTTTNYQCISSPQNHLSNSCKTSFRGKSHGDLQSLQEKNITSSKKVK